MTQPIKGGRPTRAQLGLERIVQVPVRVEPALLGRIAAWAREHGSSRNAALVSLIETGLAVQVTLHTAFSGVEEDR